MIYKCGTQFRHPSYGICYVLEYDNNLKMYQCDASDRFLFHCTGELIREGIENDREEKIMDCLSMTEEQLKDKIQECTKMIAECDKELNRRKRIQKEKDWNSLMEQLNKFIKNYGEIRVANSYSDVYLTEDNFDEEIGVLYGKME